MAARRLVAARGGGAAGRIGCARISAFPFSGAGDVGSEGAHLTAFVQGLKELGWIDGGNVRIDTRWSGGDAERNSTHAAELVASCAGRYPGSGGYGCRTVATGHPHMPVVFTQVGDPVGAGFVETLARPGGNATGFILSRISVLARNGWNCSSRLRQA